jgi:hypothetical protein
MKKLLVLYTLLVFQSALFAQERTFLPYSIFGIGELHSKGFVRNMAMGKSGIALSSGSYLNNLNPASYHSIDSVSFFFDFGLTSDFVKYRTSYATQHGNDMNLSNVAFGFRINHNWSASIGIAPYSAVGYKVVTVKSLEGTIDNFDAVLTGNGGLTQFYWNNSYLLFNRLSLGVNFTYLFGNIKSTETVTSTSEFTSNILYEQNSYLNKVYADFGFQYFFPLKDNFQVTLGGIFGNSHKLNFRHRITISDSEGTIEDKITKRGTFDLPMYFGGGIAVLFKDKLTFSADYLFHDWSGTTSDNPDFNYINTNAFKIGAEFIPGRLKQLGYFGRIRYRAGYYHEESYLEIKKGSISDNGITVGLGLPFLQNKTSINIAYNKGVNGTLENGLIKENYNSIMVSLTLHDWWFIKRKYD